MIILPYFAQHVYLVRELCGVEIADLEDKV